MGLLNEKKRGSREEKKPLLGSTSDFDLPTAKAESFGLGDRYPTQHGGCWSNVFFTWVTPLLKLGNLRPLEAEDLYQLDPYNRSHSISERFHAMWQVEKQKTKPSLPWALAKAFGSKFILAGFLKLIHDALQFVGPMIIKYIIAYLSDPDAPLSEGLIYAGIIFASGVIQSFSLRQYFFYCFETGMQLRSAVCTAVFEKSLLLSAAARQKKTTGEITNLMSIDAQRLQELTPYLHGIWYAAFQIIVSCYLLWHQIGPATFAGVAVIILLLPVMALISKAMRGLQLNLMKVKDERIKVCHEALSGIKVIKLKAWENSFAKRIMEYRDDELGRLKTYMYAQSGSNTLFSVVPALVTVVSFLTYVLLGNILDVGTALTSLALFNILRFPLFMLPQVLNNVVEASVSFERLRNFFLEEERVKVGAGSLKEVGVLLKDADFEWEGVAATSSKENTSKSKELKEPTSTTGAITPEGPILHDINFYAKSGQLWAIVGHVGSGKSTLLSGILGDARCSRGEVYLNGSVAYVSQQPFIQNATVRDNITFGLPFVKEKYEEALLVSSLKKDLKILPGGDLTEIGEKGINLSGGQRTRVAIARAVYQNADVYILDDILSAVDSHVGSDIFKNCIKKTLKNKLVLFVTHSLSFLNKCDQVVVIESGVIVEQGAYAQLMKKNGVLANMVANYVEQVQEEESPAAQTGIQCPEVSALEEEEQDDSEGSSDSADDRQERRSRTSSTRSNESSTKKTNKLIVDEDRSTGDVEWRVYYSWIHAFGGIVAGLAVIVAFVLAQGVSLLSTVWISYWSEHAQKYPQDQMYYVYVFMALNGLYAFMSFLRVLFLYLGGLRASRILFNDLFYRILRAPVSFFDTTPLGRVINRLSKDVYTVDESIPGTWNGLLNTVIFVLVTLATISYATPIFMVILAPLMIGYYVSQQYFIKTSRELQRLDNISRSPVFALLAETLDGLATIRAYNVEGSFIHRNESLLDRNQRAYFLNFAVNCWLALRLEFVGTMIATGAALAAVLAHNSNSQQGALFAGLAGVSLTYAFNVTQSLNWTVRMVSQLQTQMVSVERIKHYSEMPVEAALKSEDQYCPPRDWPDAGQVSFEHVSLRYRPGLPRVLRDLTFIVHPKEKIGVVGRTGAGKSSLIVALMRLTELDAGKIVIDGVDISKIGLHDLRGRIAIIPQDPVLFSGTVRSNLDPFDQFSDDQIWTSIKRASLSNAVTALDEKVEEKGTNFSVGERQLLCIARALLKRSKLILMDEATASIDTETDRKIQKSIHEEFKDCTCLTIAHRLNTILDADRILVMEKGTVAEFGTPIELQKKTNGIFKSLVDHWRQEKENK